MSNEIRQVKMLLEAMALSEGNPVQLKWVHAYAHGRTSTNDDPYIILYGPDYLDHKITQVYDRDFKKLPDYVDTNVSDDAGTWRTRPSRSDAQRMGILRECRPFQIVTREGRETQMGREVRFYGVYRLGREVEEVTEAPPAPTRTNGARPSLPPQRPAEPPPEPPVPSDSARRGPEILYQDGNPVDTTNRAEVQAYHAFLGQKRRAAPSKSTLRDWVRATGWKPAEEMANV